MEVFMMMIDFLLESEVDAHSAADVRGLVIKGVDVRFVDVE
jgi:hypothetical protein